MVQILGVIVEQTERQEKEIDARANNTIRRYNSLKDSVNKKEASHATKLAVCKIKYCPTLTFGCESWVYTFRKGQRQNPGC